jgi:hypothetical protein
MGQKDKNMPTIPGVVSTFDKLVKLHKLKNDDYTGDNGVFFNFDFAEYLSSLFKNARDKVYAVMLGIKLARLSVVLTKTPNNETVEDTFDDAIVYMAIWKADFTSRKSPAEVRHDRVNSVTIRETPLDPNAQ